MQKEKSLCERILLALKSALNNKASTLHAPIFGGNEWNYIKDCLDSTYVSSVGPYVNEFESQLTNYTKSKYAIAVVNGTSALHIALILAGVKREDEVLLPSMTFVATANAVSYCGAIPHFVDVERNTLGIDTERLYQYLKKITEISSGICINKNSGRPIKAIIPMHVFGHPSNIDGL